jgi:hypothetical protein
MLCWHPCAFIGHLYEVYRLLYTFLIIYIIDLYIYTGNYVPSYVFIIIDICICVPYCYLCPFIGHLRTMYPVTHAYILIY